MPPRQTKWVFTFKPDTFHPTTGEPLAGRFVRAPNGLDESDARTWAVLQFSDRWADQMSSIRFGIMNEARKVAQEPDPAKPALYEILP